MIENQGWFLMHWNTIHEQHEKLGTVHHQTHPQHDNANVLSSDAYSQKEYAVLFYQTTAFPKTPRST